MSFLKKIIFICLVVVFAFSILQISFAEEINLKLAWCETLDPKKKSDTATCFVFKKCVEELSGGEIKVSLYPAGQLGTAKEILEQTKKGLIQACNSIPSGMIAGKYDPNFNIFDIPYLFPNTVIAWRTLNVNAPFFEKIQLDLIERTGLRLLSMGCGADRHFTNNIRPIKSPEYLKGLKIRIMETPVYIELVKALGGSPIPVPWLELYFALQTGVVDGEENTLENVYFAKIFEVQKYLTLDGHNTLFCLFIMNNDWYESLSERHQKIIDQSAEMAEIAGRGLLAINSGQAIENLQDKIGITVLSPEEKEKWKKLAQPAVLKYVKSTISNPELLDELLKAIDEASGK